MTKLHWGNICSQCSTRVFSRFSRIRDQLQWQMWPWQRNDKCVSTTSATHILCKALWKQCYANIQERVIISRKRPEHVSNIWTNLATAEPRTTNTKLPSSWQMIPPTYPFLWCLGVNDSQWRDAREQPTHLYHTHPNHGCPNAPQTVSASSHYNWTHVSRLALLDLHLQLWASISVLLTSRVIYLFASFALLAFACVVVFSYLSSVNVDV
jgi:hypothetical protein